MNAILSCLIVIWFIDLSVLAQHIAFTFINPFELRFAMYISAISIQAGCTIMLLYKK